MTLTIVPPWGEQAGLPPRPMEGPSISMIAEFGGPGEDRSLRKEQRGHRPTDRTFAAIEPAGTSVQLKGQEQHLGLLCPGRRLC